MNKAFEIALSQYGIKEISGSKHNPEVLKYFINGGSITDETAWCSAFMNWSCKEGGYEYSGKLNARSWLNVGIKISKPKQGDIVIFWRESPESWKGHVGFFVDDRNGWTRVLGGNQRNEVNITGYPTSRVLGYRRLSLSSKPIVISEHIEMIKGQRFKVRQQYYDSNNDGMYDGIEEIRCLLPSDCIDVDIDSLEKDCIKRKINN